MGRSKEMFWTSFMDFSCGMFRLFLPRSCVTCCPCKPRRKDASIQSPKNATERLREPALLPCSLEMHYTIIWVETFTQPLTHKMVQFVPAYLQLPHIPLRDALTGIKSASASSVTVASASAVAFGLLDSSRANCA